MEERIQFSPEEIDYRRRALREALLTNVVEQTGTKEGARHISDETLQEALSELKELQREG